MISLLQNRQGLWLTGAGPAVLVWTGAAALIAVLFAITAPQWLDWPWGTADGLGWHLVALGVVWWGSALVQLLTAFGQGNLVTTGAYGVCRNPVYSSLLWLVFPGLSLVSGSWLWLVPSVGLWLGIQVHIQSEEKRIELVFGQDYREYQAQVGRTLPRWRGWRRIAEWIRRRPVQAFVVFTLTWSYLWWGGMASVGTLGDVIDHFEKVWPFVVMGGFGPSLAGLFLTRFTGERGAWRSLGQRLATLPSGAWWLVLLLIPALTAAVPLIRWGLGLAPGPEAWVPLLGPGLALGLTAGLMEEFGWRGFLLPKLLQQWSGWRSALIVGLIWGGLWHGYADWWGLGDRGWGAVPLILLLGPGLLTAWSLVLTRVYQRTRASLLFSILVHASISSSALFLGQTYSNLSEELAWTALQVTIDAIGALLFWRWTRERTEVSK